MGFAIDAAVGRQDAKVLALLRRRQEL